jgi:hypothetical protein
LGAECLKIVGWEEWPIYSNCDNLMQSLFFRPQQGRAYAGKRSGSKPGFVHQHRNTEIVEQMRVGSIYRYRPIGL